MEVTKPADITVRPDVCPMDTRGLISTILTFVEKVNGIELYSYQKALAYRVIESLLMNDGASITALFSRQSGKSETLASVSVALCLLLPTLAKTWPGDQRLSMFANGVLIGVFAPKLDLSGPIYLKIRSRAEGDVCQEVMADPDLNISLTQSRGDSLAFTNGSAVRASTASDTTINEGATYHLVLIDEAQRVTKSKVAKEIAPMLAATNGSMVKIGTAWMSRGGFHNDIQFNIEEEKRGGKRNHFQFPYDQVIVEKRSLYNRQKKEYEDGKRAKGPDAFHLNYEKWVNSELNRLGGNKDNEEFKMNFRLLWQESRVIAIKEALLMELQMPNAEMNLPKHFGFQVAALDVAKKQDSTVLTVMEVDKAAPIVEGHATMDKGQPALFYRKFILGWLELQGSFEGIQYQAIVNYLKDYKVTYMLVDSTGMGDPVCERLQVLLAPAGITVEPFRYTLPSKSDLYKYYMQELDARRVRYPSGTVTQRSSEYQKFLQQHLDLEREWHGSYLVCSSDDHDDYPDSAAMAVWASKEMEEVMPLVEMESSDYLYGRSSDNRLAWASGGSDQGRSARYLRRKYR